MVNAIRQELTLRAPGFQNEPIQTIYFGGGTPSLLTGKELSALIAQIEALFDLAPNPEITLEANPDDLNRKQLQQIKNAGINRLSIGIQTFDDDRLKFINRAHSQQEATSCLELAQSEGFTNISADLIYAIPPDSMEYWVSDIQTLLGFNLTHISLYGLTIEEKTVFGNWVKKGKLTEVKEAMAAAQYRYAIDTLTAHGYDHYEVSNFARPGGESRHNSAYWDDQKYLGVGPGAHSYDGEVRAFNVSHNAQYLTAIGTGKLPLTYEQLSKTDRMNEYIFTHLRTKKGIDLKQFEHLFGSSLERNHQRQMDHFTANDLAKNENGCFALTTEGLMVADEISWRLFYDESNIPTFRPD